jgi:hypothetical protein
MLLMKTTSWLLVYSVVATGLASCPGCGKPEAEVPKTYPVSIKIAHGGQPVEGASVTFVPQEQSGRGASGVTDANGVAKMGLPGLADGAVPGKYWVTVSKVEGAQSDPNISAEEFYEQQSGDPAAAPASPKHLLPMKYLSAQSGGLECEVKEQQDQLFEFDLTD